MTSDVDMKKKTTDGIPASEVVLPNLRVYELLHVYRLPYTTPEKKEEARLHIMEEIKRDEMLPLYLSLCEEFHWEKDEELVKTLTLANEKELEEIAKAHADAEDNYGDVEVKDCYLAKANFYCRIGDTKNVIEAYELAQGKCVGAGGRLNITLTVVRFGILNKLKAVAKKYIALAKKECVKGGDWEKRNKLKVYEALFLVEHGRFVEAAEHMISCVAIFTASEIIHFEKFVYFTVILAMATFDRPTLKSKIMNCSEITQVLQENKMYEDFLHSFFYCRYDQFTVSLVCIYYLMREYPFLMDHAHYLIRTIRYKAYQQYLTPYSSVLLKSMASAFRLSEEFLEKDIVEFIVNDKLPCKIDRLKGVIVCTRHVAVGNLYIEAIKQGDLLLEKLQKLAKIIDT